MAPAEPPVARSRLLAYALPGFVFAMPTLPVAISLPTMYSAELGLAAAGLALLIARAFDVVTDPAVGALSDRWQPRWGRRKPWIVAGALVGGVSLIQLFQPPPGVSFAYVTVWSLLLYVGWTMVSIPYNAWGAEMSTDYHQRTRITSAREGAMLLGILLASALPAAAVGLGMTEREALALLSWLAVSLGGPFVAWMLIKVPDPLPREAAPSRAEFSWTRLKAEALIVVENHPFRRLIGAWFINGLANGIPSALFLLFLDHRLQAGPGQRGALILMYFLCAVVAIPAWLALSKRHGKHRVWCWAMMMACAAFAWVPLLAPGDIWLFALVCAVTGFALGADLALPPALQADVVDLDVARTGRNRAGLFFALWGMATKLALAGAIGIAFPALAFFGFDTDGGGTPRGLFALAVIYSLVPVVLKVVAIALVWNFRKSMEGQGSLRRDVGGGITTERLAP